VESRNPKRLWMKMTMEEIRELGQSEVRPVVLLPVGSIEGHGPHLSVDCDSYNAIEFSKRIAEAGASQGPIVVAPPLYFGYSEWMDYPGKVSLTSGTFIAVITDVCHSLITQGFRHIAIVNGHGGNVHVLNIAVQDLYLETKCFIPIIDWFMMAHDVCEEVISTSTRHADEGETSVALALGNEVDMSKAGRETPCEPFGQFLSLRHIGGTSRIGVPCTTISRRSHSGIFGDATLATRDKGDKIVVAVVSRALEVLSEYRRMPQERPVPQEK